MTNGKWRAGACHLMLATIALGLGGSAGAYDFWQYDAGRADYLYRYDLAGYTWPAQGGNAIYDFGQIGTFAANPPGVDAVWLSAAVNDVAGDWERWGNFDFADTLGASGTGKVRLAAADLGTAPEGTTPAKTVAALGASGSLIDYATITFNLNRAITWTKDFFTGVLKHELGHVLGLDDLYQRSAPLSEEFVDHPVGSAAIPERPLLARQDNIMAGDGPWYYGSPHLVIDNDEIAGLTWLWGGKYNQIVSGDLADTWNLQHQDRDTDPHHGVDPNNGGLGWWDYRGTVASPRADGAFPYIDLQFPGYQTFIGHAFGNAPWTHQSLGNGIERFIIEQADWTGNFDLWVQSSFTREGRINAWVQGAGLDEFILPADIDGLAFARDTNGSYMWATIFGPAVPEPPTIALVALCLAGMALLGRSCTAVRALPA